MEIESLVELARLLTRLRLYGNVLLISLQNPPLNQCSTDAVPLGAKVDTEIVQIEARHFVESVFISYLHEAT